MLCFQYPCQPRNIFYLFLYNRLTCLQLHKPRRIHTCPSIILHPNKKGSQKNLPTDRLLPYTPVTPERNVRTLGQALPSEHAHRRSIPGPDSDKGRVGGEWTGE